MSARPDVDRSVSAWLEAQVPERAPERLLEASRDEIRITPQRRVPWPAWRFPYMNTYAKLAIAAAAVLVVAVVGSNLLPGDSGAGGQPAATPSPSPDRSPSPLPLTGNLEAGTIYSSPPGEVAFTFAVPTSDWTYAMNGYLGGHDVTGDITYLSFFSSTDNVPGVFADSCVHEGDLRTFDPTPTGNAEAMATLSGVEVLSEPTEVTVDGRPGTSVVVRVPDAPGCTNQDYWLTYSASCQAEMPSVGCTSYPWWLGETIRSWFVEVDGAVFTVTAETLSPNASADLETELQQIVDSIRFE